MIPKVINYCWFGGKSKPKELKKNIDSWKKYCPDYKIIEWNETNFDVNGNEFVRSAYEAKAFAFVSDYARLKIIYDNGGIYFDTDVEVLQNIDKYLQYDAFFGIQQQELLCNTGLGFGATPQNMVVRKMLDEYNEIIFSKDIASQISCPWLNQKVIEKLGYHYSNKPININNTLIVPPQYMDPLAPGNSKNLLSDETITVHHYSASWTPFRSRIKRKFINYIGQSNIYRLKKFLNLEHKGEN